MLVWARITQGEHRIALLLLADKQATGLHRTRLALDVYEAWRRSRTSRPGRHWAELKRVLHTYADQLAARIDAGWPAELGHSGQQESIFLAN